MDFIGQKLADRLHQIITAVFGVIGFFYGFQYQRFGYTMYISGIGLAISALLCVPDWGYLNRNPLKWQPPIDENSEEDADDSEDEVPVKKAKSKKSGKNSVKRRNKNK
mmetsp:Transcript_20768/g.36972  ORF Transcript_20768/g.36972 Transcript_20768/m.36972 type:complete len:108 (-) Transcript_20768:79-402(-)